MDNEYTERMRSERKVLETMVSMYCMPAGTRMKL